MPLEEMREDETPRILLLSQKAGRLHEGWEMRRKCYLLAPEEWMGQGLWGGWGGKGACSLRKGQKGWKSGGKGIGI